MHEASTSGQLRLICADLFSFELFKPCGDSGETACAVLKVEMAEGWHGNRRRGLYEGLGEREVAETSHGGEDRVKGDGTMGHRGDGVDVARDPAAEGEEVGSDGQENAREGRDLGLAMVKCEVEMAEGWEGSGDEMLREARKTKINKRLNSR
jgi:hypothetical protein